MTISFLETTVRKRPASKTSSSETLVQAKETVKLPQAKVIGSFVGKLDTTNEPPLSSYVYDFRYWTEAFQKMESLSSSRMEL